MSEIEKKKFQFDTYYKTNKEGVIARLIQDDKSSVPFEFAVSNFKDCTDITLWFKPDGSIHGPSDLVVLEEKASDLDVWKAFMDWCSRGGDIKSIGGKCCVFSSVPSALDLDCSEAIKVMRQYFKEGVYYRTSQEGLYARLKCDDGGVHLPFRFIEGPMNTLSYWRDWNASRNSTQTIFPQEASNDEIKEAFAKWKASDEYDASKIGSSDCLFMKVPDGMEEEKEVASKSFRPKVDHYYKTSIDGVYARLMRDDKDDLPFIFCSSSPCPHVRGKHRTVWARESLYSDNGFLGQDDFRVLQEEVDEDTIKTLYKKWLEKYGRKDLVGDIDCFFHRVPEGLEDLNVQTPQDWVRKNLEVGKIYKTDKAGVLTKFVQDDMDNKPFKFCLVMPDGDIVCRWESAPEVHDVRILAEEASEQDVLSAFRAWKKTSSEDRISAWMADQDFLFYGIKDEQKEQEEASSEPKKPEFNKYYKTSQEGVYVRLSEDDKSDIPYRFVSSVKRDGALRGFEVFWTHEDLNPYDGFLGDDDFRVVLEEVDASEILDLYKEWIDGPGEKSMINSRYCFFFEEPKGLKEDGASDVITEDVKFYIDKGGEILEHRRFSGTHSLMYTESRKEDWYFNNSDGDASGTPYQAVRAATDEEILQYWHRLSDNTELRDQIFPEGCPGEEKEQDEVPGVSVASHENDVASFFDLNKFLASKYGEDKEVSPCGNVLRVIEVTAQGDDSDCALVIAAKVALRGQDGEHSVTLKRWCRSIHVDPSRYEDKALPEMLPVLSDVSSALFEQYKEVFAAVAEMFKQAKELV